MARKYQLQHSPSIKHFPAVKHRQEVSLVKEAEFWPVLKTKRYNILKLHELKQLQEKDRRLGRLSS